MFVRVMLGVLLLGTLTGCSTTQSPAVVNQLQIRVSQVERRLDKHDQDVAALKYDMKGLEAGARQTTNMVDMTDRVASENVSSSDYADILRVSVSAKDVQKALKNAGYYKGAVDGKLGAGSQKAIEAFQKENNLKIDGVIGKQTWDELKTYLSNG